MNKLFVAMLAVVAGLYCLADNAGKKLSPEEIAANKDKFMRRTGGIVEGQTKGSCYLFIDATKGKKANHDKTIKQMQTGCEILVKVEDGVIDGNCPIKFGLDVIKSRKDVGAVTIIYDGEAGGPIEIIAPMSKVAVINATPLKGNDFKYGKRINALMWRSLIFNAGGVMPFGTECVMQNVFSVADVDALKAVAAYPGVTQLVANNAPDYGFAMKKRGLYSVACSEGWAEAPTNEYQKAIWEKVKAEQSEKPTEGIKIKYDPLKAK